MMNGEYKSSSPVMMCELSFYRSPFFALVPESDPFSLKKPTTVPQEEVSTHTPKASSFASQL